MPHTTLEQALAAQPAALHLFQRLGSVTGIGVTRLGDDYAIKVNLREPIRAGVDVPAHIDGVPLHIHVTGEIRPL